jgi:hypothetical protein
MCLNDALHWHRVYLPHLDLLCREKFELLLLTVRELWAAAADAKVPSLEVLVSVVTVWEVLSLEVHSKLAAKSMAPFGTVVD